MMDKPTQKHLLTIVVAFLLIVLAYLAVVQEDDLAKMKSPAKGIAFQKMEAVETDVNRTRIPTAPSPTAGLLVKVRSRSFYRPIKGAEIREATADGLLLGTTESNGNCQLSQIHGRLRINVLADGYLNKTQDLELGDIRECIIVLESTSRFVLRCIPPPRFTDSDYFGIVKDLDQGPETSTVYPKDGSLSKRLSAGARYRLEIRGDALSSPLPIEFEIPTFGGTVDLGSVHLEELGSLTLRVDHGWHPGLIAELTKCSDSHRFKKSFDQETCHFERLPPGTYVGIIRSNRLQVWKEDISIISGSKTITSVIIEGDTTRINVVDLEGVEIEGAVILGKTEGERIVAYTNENGVADVILNGVSNVSVFAPYTSKSIIVTGREHDIKVILPLEGSGALLVQGGYAGERVSLEPSGEVLASEVLARSPRLRQLCEGRPIDENGVANFDQVPPGAYEITAKDGLGQITGIGLAWIRPNETTQTFISRSQGFVVLQLAEEEWDGSSVHFRKGKTDKISVTAHDGMQVALIPGRYDYCAHSKLGAVFSGEIVIDQNRKQTLALGGREGALRIIVEAGDPGLISYSPRRWPSISKPLDVSEMGDGEIQVEAGSYYVRTEEETFLINLGAGETREVRIGTAKVSVSLTVPSNWIPSQLLLVGPRVAPRVIPCPVQGTLGGFCGIVKIAPGEYFAIAMDENRRAQGCFTVHKIEETQEITVKLESRQIVGRVLSKLGSPVASAVISARLLTASWPEVGALPIAASSWTNEAGEFEFDQLVPGTYTISVGGESTIVEPRESTILLRLQGR